MTGKTVVASLVLAAAALCPASASARTVPEARLGFAVGQFQRSIEPAQPRYWRGGRSGLSTRIWFPAEPGKAPQPHEIGAPGAAMFRAHPLVPDATIASARRRYPLIVLSHGTGGTADSLDWLAASLVEAGYIVAAVDHPGNSLTGPMTWDGFTLWWERATDLSNAIDALLADPAIGPRIDRERIGAAGFSLGGYTVLALAGARTDLAAFLAFCKSPAADTTCHPPGFERLPGRPKEGDVPSAERQASLARSGGSFRDDRVKAVFAIAPAVGQAFVAGSMADLRVPVSIVVGEADRIAPAPTNAGHIARILPKARLTVLPGVGHFTFLPVCVSALAARMPDICADGPGIDRAAVHARTAGMAAAFFARALK